MALAALAFAGLFFYRRRRNNRAGIAARKEEVEDYGYNPNLRADDAAGEGGTNLGSPGAPSGSDGGLGSGLLGADTIGSAGAVAGGTALAADSDGYRGWGRSGHARVSSNPSNSALEEGAGTAAYGAPPMIPPKSQDRYAGGMHEALDADPSLSPEGQMQQQQPEYDDTAPAAAVNRSNTTASRVTEGSNYSTNSQDEYAGHMPQPELYEPPDPTHYGGRNADTDNSGSPQPFPGRRRMGAGGNSAVNF